MQLGPRLAVISRRNHCHAGCLPTVCLPGSEWITSKPDPSAWYRQKAANPPGQASGNVVGIDPAPTLRTLSPCRRDGVIRSREAPRACQASPRHLAIHGAYTRMNGASPRRPKRAAPESARAKNRRSESEAGRGGAPRRLPGSLRKTPIPRECVSALFRQANFSA